MISNLNKNIDTGTYKCTVEVFDDQSLLWEYNSEKFNMINIVGMCKTIESWKRCCFLQFIECSFTY